MLEILIALSQTVHFAFVLDLGSAAIQALNRSLAFHLSEKTHHHFHNDAL